jgi:hypothetical protein
MSKYLAKEGVADSLVKPIRNKVIKDSFYGVNYIENSWGNSYEQQRFYF